MNRIVANTTVLTFILQFYKIISNISRYERILENYDGCEIYEVIRCAGGCYKFPVTQELVEALKHSAFARYASLRKLGAIGILERFLERQQSQDNSQTEAPILSISNGL